MAVVFLDFAQNCRMRKAWSRRRVGLLDTGLLLGWDHALTSSEQQSEETSECFVIISTEELELVGAERKKL